LTVGNLLAWLALWAPPAVPAQGLAAPPSAGAAVNADVPFAGRPSGVLASPGVARRIGSFELGSAPATRALSGPSLEQLFAERCRSVVLVVAVSGSGKDEKVGTGTGSIVSPQGHVLTAAHVIAGAEQVGVGVFPNCSPGTKPQPFAVKVVKVDELADLALLRLERLPPEMSVMPLGDLAAVRTGSPVVMIGHPRGLLMSMSQGVVSAIRPNFKWSPQGSHDMEATVIQTDGAINPGNSGGPMMTTSGHLIGVNSFIRGQASAGLNFAVSVDDVRTFFTRSSNRLAPAPAQAAAAGGTGQAAGGGTGTGGAGGSAGGGGNCKPRVLKEWKEDGATRRSIDLDCSGRANGLLVIPDNPGQRAALLWDRNGDNKADVRFFLTRSMQPEYSEWDDDFDGSYEWGAEHEGGDWEPKTKTRLASR
jgi:S1-C subfamily serine protease